MTRPADDIRMLLINEVLTGYLPAIQWNEDESPFTLSGDKILLTRQSGQASDEDIRELIVECWLFSKVNATKSDLNNLFNDATAAMAYTLTNYAVGSIIGISVIEDVTGPFNTGQNRKFFRFTLRTLVNS